MRCDEQRPACNRCVSTGRKCDGYATDPSHWASTITRSSASPSSTGSATPGSRPGSRALTPSNIELATLGLGARLQFLSGDPEQTRSFRYFLTVAAPAIAGTFNARFWTDEIPRACHEDPAIWHAIVSLGAVYEDHVAQAIAKTHKTTTQPYRNTFALQHFNQAVQHLIRPGRRTRRDKWRALVASTVFIAVCMVEGLYDQARIHLKAGNNLLTEIEAEETSSSSSERDSPPRHGPEPQRNKSPRSSPASTPLVPITVSSLRSVLVGLDLFLQGMTNGGVLSMSTFMFPEDPMWSVWSSYSGPTLGKWQDILTSEKLAESQRAAESLLYENVMFAQRHMQQYQSLFIDRKLETLNMVAAVQKPLVHSFKELHKATAVFGWALDEASASHANNNTEGESLDLARLRLSLYFLSMYLGAIRIFVVPALKDFSLSEDYATIATACETVVRMGEQIHDLEASIKLRSRQTILGPNPPLATPVTIVAVAGPNDDLRRRAIKIVRRPRIEGFLDSSPTASLCEAILAGEAAADREHRQRSAADGLDTDPTLKGHVQSDEMHPLSRSYASGFASSRRGEGVVRVRTWRDMLNGAEGRNINITW